jgi:hypothetical protein
MNKRSWKVVGLLAVVIFLISACDSLVGSEDIVTETRDVSNFDSVSLDGSGDAIITQGGEESLTVETDDNVQEYITSEVRDGTLYLSKKTRSPSATKLIFRVGVDDISGLEVSGSGDISADNLIADQLEIKIGSSGSVNINELTAGKVETEIDGSGDVELTGEVTGQTIEIGSSGEYIGGDLHSETAAVTISGSGDATVWTTESLETRINKSGSVNYYGDPSVSSSGSGSGDVNNMGSK